MQPAIVSLYKNSKVTKAQSTDNPTSEEEEKANEKECGCDEFFYNDAVLSCRIQTGSELTWHIPIFMFFSHPSDILIPPPKA